MAEEGAPDPSITPPATTFPSEPVPSQAPPDTVQPTQPRTIGGFVDEDDDDAEEKVHNSDEMSASSASSDYDPNEDAGGSAIPAQQDPPPTYDVTSYSLSRPQSSMASAAPQQVSHTTGQEEEQAFPDPASLQHQTSAPVTNGFQTDAVLSPTASSHTALVGRDSINPTPVNALTSASRPTTANGATLQSPATAAPAPSRLPSDHIGILEDRIQEDPRGDVDAWFKLVEEHKRRGKTAEVRKTYDRMLEMFPTWAEQWVAYVAFESEQERFAEAETVMKQSISRNPNFDLWMTYLGHVQRRQPLTGPNAEQHRKVVDTVFQFVLDGVGQDKEAGRLWQEYIKFLKTHPGILGGSEWMDKQKMDIVRQGYQRAIAVPTDAVENLWREYDKFEMDLNKMTGRKNLQEKSTEYMTARSVKTTLYSMTRGLDRSTRPRLPPQLGFEGDEEYMQQVQLWRNWIAWEKDDPLAFADENKPEALQKRVLLVYKQATMSLVFWPEIWFEAAEYCYSISQPQTGDQLLDQGLEANPESCLLAFKKAERIELTTTNNDTEASIKERGEKVRVPFDKCLNALYGIADKNLEREKKEIARLNENFSQQNGHLPTIMESTEQNGDEQDEFKAEDIAKEHNARLIAVKASAKEQEVLCKKLITATWIALTRALRRIQGKGYPNSTPFPGMRGIFMQARKRGRLNSDYYIACALLEHHCYKDPTAIRLFERGLKLFPEDENFAAEYIKHLINTNDMINARVIFEKFVEKATQNDDSKKTPEEKLDLKMRAKSVFRLFHNYESLYGELDQVKKLEKRISTLYPEDPSLTLFAQRHAEPGIDPCAVRPVISPRSQTQGKISALIDQITKETPSPSGSPRAASAYFGNGANPSTRSPKRPLDDSDSEGPARKVARGESPLKGAAGRRMALDAIRRTGLANEVTPQQTPAQSYHAPPPTLPQPVFRLLSAIPPAHTYEQTRFDAQKMAQLLQGVDLSRVDINQRNAVWQQQHQPQAPATATYAPPPPNPQMYYQHQQQQAATNYGGQSFYGNTNAYGYTR